MCLFVQEYFDLYFDCFCMLLFPGVDPEFSESFPVSAAPEDYGVSCASGVFGGLSDRATLDGRCCRYFVLDAVSWQVVAYSQGSANKLFPG